MLTRGQRLGRYVVEGVVGVGGMAVVYRVRHVQLASFWALKVLTSSQGDVKERLLREGRFQSALRHQNIVGVADLIDINGSPSLLMEYVDGPGLDRWIRAVEPSIEEAESLFRGICAGVREAHAAGLVHRDLKPANVLLARTAVGFVPKVTDFGIAKVVDSEDTVHFTHGDAALGTPAYMAPEQIRHASAVDQRADVFSLGCLFFELLCGARSFRGPDVLSVLNAVVKGDRVDPRAHVPSLPDRLVNVIDGCLKVDWEERFESVDEILKALGDGAASPVTTGLDRVWEDWFTEDERQRREAWLSDDDAATIPPDDAWLNRAAQSFRDTQPKAGDRRRHPPAPYSADADTDMRNRQSLAASDDDTQPGVRSSGDVTEPRIARRSGTPNEITEERTVEKSSRADLHLGMAAAVGALGGALGLVVTWALFSLLS